MKTSARTYTIDRACRILRRTSDAVRKRSTEHRDPETDGGMAVDTEMRDRRNKKLQMEDDFDSDVKKNMIYFI